MWTSGSLLRRSCSVQRSRVRRVSLIFAVVLAVIVCGSLASVITYRQPDGNRHPNVGALVGVFDGQTYPYCS
jgi:hypothetical protein